MDRLEVLSQINELEDRNCASCTLVQNGKDLHTCKFICDIGKDIAQLGNKLLNENSEDYKKILAKGKDITTKEIKFLIDKGINKTEIVRSLGMDNQRAFKIIDSVTEGLELAEIKRNKTIKEEIEQLVKEGKSIEEIQDITGYKKGTISTYVYRTRRELKQKDKKGDEKVKALPIKKESIDYKALFEESQKKLKEVEEKYKRSLTIYEQLEDEYEKLSRDYKELSKEIANGVSTNNKEIESLTNIISELTKELEIERQKHDALFKYITSGSVEHGRSAV